MALFSLTSLFLLLLPLIGGFPMPLRRKSAYRSDDQSILCRRLKMADSSNNFDVDLARKRLETLVSGTGESASSVAEGQKEVGDGFTLEGLLSSDQRSVESQLPPHPPLSTIERERRRVEVKLLKQLEYSDEATSGLWELWYSERGKEAKSVINEADRLIAEEDPSSWREAETMLVGLVEEFGIYFVEPLNRLATLYFLRGRLEESYKLCRVILKIKPWHFGAASGIVQGE